MASRIGDYGRKTTPRRPPPAGRGGRTEKDWMETLREGFDSVTKTFRRHPYLVMTAGILLGVTLGCLVKRT